MIYEPREDSYLMLKSIKGYAEGRVLDMGTGSGILAQEAQKYADEVVAADINPQAVKECRQKGLRAVKSDLFSNIRGSYDLIIFNPPYLPDDSRVSDIALDGGTHGYEVIERFLTQAADHLAENGRILLLFSSYSNKQRIQQFIAEKCLSYKEIDSLKIDFEKLYVYLVEKTPVLKALEKKGVKNISYLAKGHRGMVFTGAYRGQMVAVKAKNPSSAASTMENEAKFLKVVNRHGIGPKLLFLGRNYLVYRFVAGERILDFIKKAQHKLIRAVLNDIIRQLALLDELGINKAEMHRPVKHILVGKKPVLIDFERARYSQKPHNVTQFCQFLSHLAPDLNAKGFNITKQQMINIGRAYAKENNVEQLLQALK
jgi:HemK-related putative methylase